MIGALGAARLIVGAGGLVAACLGGGMAALHHDVRAGAAADVRAAEAAIRADIALTQAAPSAAATAAAAADRRIIHEARLQLALAKLQEVVRAAVTDHGGDIASLSGADPVAQPWGATLRLTARFDAPHAAIIDIFSALEAGTPFVRAEEATLSRRTSPGASGADDLRVTADVVFSAFTSARPAIR